MAVDAFADGLVGWLRGLGLALVVLSGGQDRRFWARTLAFLHFHPFAAGEEGDLSARLQLAVLLSCGFLGQPALRELVVELLDLFHEGSVVSGLVVGHGVVFVGGVDLCYGLLGADSDQFLELRLGLRLQGDDFVLRFCRSGSDLSELYCLELL